MSICGVLLAHLSNPLSLTIQTNLYTLLALPREQNLSFETIAHEIGRDEIWVAAVFYGQAKPLPKDIAALAALLDVDVEQFTAERGDQWWPQRGALTPFPPTDPVIYRLYEVRVGLCLYDAVEDDLGLRMCYCGRACWFMASLSRFVDSSLVQPTQTRLLMVDYDTRGLGLHSRKSSSAPRTYRTFNSSSFLPPPQFGDGIISMINCKVHLERKSDPEGTRITPMPPPVY